MSALFIWQIAQIGFNFLMDWCKTKLEQKKDNTDQSNQREGDFCGAY